MVITWYGLHGYHPDDITARRLAEPWYDTKTEPSFEDMLTKLRRTLIAARFTAVRPGPGRVPENRTAIMTRRSLMSMSSNARFGLGPVPRLGGPAAVDVGGAVAGTGVPDNDQGVHEHREWHVALHGPLDPVAGLTCAQHVASVGERHG